MLSCFNYFVSSAFGVRPEESAEPAWAGFPTGCVSCLYRHLSAKDTRTTWSRLDNQGKTDSSNVSGYLMKGMRVASLFILRGKDEASLWDKLSTQSDFPIYSARAVLDRQCVFWPASHLCVVVSTMSSSVCALATGKVGSISTSVRINCTVSLAKALGSEKCLLFCNSWVIQDLICSMLILTVPHVSNAARSRSLYGQEPLLYRGKEPLKTPSLQNWVGENK